MIAAGFEPATTEDDEVEEKTLPLLLLLLLLPCDAFFVDSRSGCVRTIFFSAMDHTRSARSEHTAIRSGEEEALE